MNKHSFEQWCWRLADALYKRCEAGSGVPPTRPSTVLYDWGIPIIREYVTELIKEQSKIFVTWSEDNHTQISTHYAEFHDEASADKFIAEIDANPMTFGNAKWYGARKFTVQEIIGE